MAGFLGKLLGTVASAIPGVGPVVGLAGSLIGGALDARAAKKDREWAIANRGYDLQKLRDDSIAAGFNPLTVLGATGAQAYDRLAGIPAMGSNAYIGDAIASLGDKMFTYALQESDQLARAQLALGLEGSRVASESGPYSIMADNWGGGTGAYGSQSNPIEVVQWFHNELTGNTYRGPNPDVLDISPGELATGTLIFGGLEAGQFALGDIFPTADQSGAATLLGQSSPGSVAIPTVTGGYAVAPVFGWGANYPGVRKAQSRYSVGGAGTVTRAIGPMQGPMPPPQLSWGGDHAMPGSNNPYVIGPLVPGWMP